MATEFKGGSRDSHGKGARIGYAKKSEHELLGQRTGAGERSVGKSLTKMQETPTMFMKTKEEKMVPRRLPLYL